MPKFQPISIPPASSVEELRQSTVKQINTIARTVAQSSQRTEDMDFGGNRITSVANPTAPNDAVNLATVKRMIVTPTLQPKHPQGYAWTNVTLVNGTNSNVNLSSVPVSPGGIMRVRALGLTGACTITGFTTNGGIGSTPGVLLYILNNTQAFSVTLNNNDTSSSAGNRISTQTGGNITVGSTQGWMLCLVYDGGNTLNWVVVSVHGT